MFVLFLSSRSILWISSQRLKMSTYIADLFPRYKADGSHDSWLMNCTSAASRDDPRRPASTHKMSFPSHRINGIRWNKRGSLSQKHKNTHEKMNRNNAAPIKKYEENILHTNKTKMASRFYKNHKWKNKNVFKRWCSNLYKIQ